MDKLEQLQEVLNDINRRFQNPPRREDTDSDRIKQTGRCETCIWYGMGTSKYVCYNGNSEYGGETRDCDCSCRLWEGERES